MAAQWQSTTLWTGNIKDIEALQELDALYKPGDLGELQLYLDTTRIKEGDISQEDAIKATTAFNKQLQDAGLERWPDRQKLAYLDWPQRRVSVLFRQSTTSPQSHYRPQVVVLAAFAAIGSAIITAATVALLGSLLVKGLKLAGLPVPAKVERIADVTILVTSIFTVLRFLRRIPGLGGLSLTALVGGGLLIFTLLRPDLAGKALKWTLKTAGDLLGNLPWQVLAAAGAVGAVVLASYTRRR